MPAVTPRHESNMIPQKFVDFIAEIAHGDWEYGEGEPMADDAAMLLAVIDAASEMFEALELADGFLANQGYSEHDPLVRGVIRAAIANATKYGMPTVTF